MKRATLAFAILFSLTHGLAYAQHAAVFPWGDQGDGSFRNPVLKSDYRYGASAEALGAGRPSKTTPPPSVAGNAVQGSGAAGTGASLVIPAQVPLRTAAAPQRSGPKIDGLYVE